MKKIFILIFLPAVLAFTMPGNKNEKPELINQQTDSVMKKTIEEIISTLTTRYGEAYKTKIGKGVRQASALWTEEDGDIEAMSAFFIENYAKPGDGQKALFDKLSTAFEVLFGHYNKISLDLKNPLLLGEEEIRPIDEIMGSYEPSAHFTDDFYANKTAFIVILNFPFYSLKEKEILGPDWTRLDWAYSKLGDIFTSRAPADVQQKLADALTAADTYIAGYNIYMGNLVNDKMTTLFPADLKLITHWGLRDELKSQYSEKDGLNKQKMIYEVMKKIISQEIPIEVINKNEYQWNPVSNTLYKDSKIVTSTPETNVRYNYLLENFRANAALDKYSTQYHSNILRKFDSEMQMTQMEVEKLFIEFVSSPTVKKVAALIQKRLKRKLQPFDIWYDGFKSRSSVSQTELDKAVKTKYPTKDAFEKDLPEILVKLGFTKEKAEYICEKIQVDASRGAGHAWGAQMKTDKAHLRTKIKKDGMDYKGYNIAVHEFGHNVEQTITLCDMDYYMMRGVPNTSFTEAVAFLFQQKDLELLGYNSDDINKKYLFALDNFWSTYEIMGVSLVDMRVWKWMYAHPDATADELKMAVTAIAKDVWNKFYADILGSKDEPVLAIYSHMIDNPLYLSAYPIGHLIDFQIEKYIEGKPFAGEIQRMLLAGNITPQLWMKAAVGKEISGQALIDATDEALKNVKE